MKKYTVLIAACLIILTSTGSVFAQTNPRQQSIPGQPIAPGQPITPGQQINPGQPIVPGQYGYGFQVVPVVQAWTYGHKMPIVLQGNIVHFYGGRNLYVFRDSSGDILAKIGPKEWQYVWYQGINIAPTDTVEIYGEVHWPKHSWGTPEVHVRYIKKL